MSEPVSHYEAIWNRAQRDRRCYRTLLPWVVIEGGHLGIDDALLIQRPYQVRSFHRILGSKTKDVVESPAFQHGVEFNIWRAYCWVSDAHRVSDQQSFERADECWMCNNSLILTWGVSAWSVDVIIWVPALTAIRGRHNNVLEGRVYDKGVYIIELDWSSEVEGQGIARASSGVV